MLNLFILVWSPYILTSHTLPLCLTILHLLRFFESFFSLVLTSTSLNYYKIYPLLVLILAHGILFQFLFGDFLSIMSSNFVEFDLQEYQWHTFGICSSGVNFCFCHRTTLPLSSSNLNVEVGGPAASLYSSLLFSLFVPDLLLILTSKTSVDLMVSSGLIVYFTNVPKSPPIHQKHI